MFDWAKENCKRVNLILNTICESVGCFWSIKKFLFMGKAILFFFPYKRFLEKENLQVLVSLTSNDIFHNFLKKSQLVRKYEWTCSKLLQSSFIFNCKSMHKQTWNNFSEIGLWYAYLRKWLHKALPLRIMILKQAP
jgi:hypothetical protein